MKIKFEHKRTRLPRGGKLHQKPELEKEVVKWFMLENVSNYEAVKRLNKLGFEITEPSIKSWKDNYYESLKKDISVNMDKIEINSDKLEQISELRKLLKLVDDRIEIVSKIIESRVTKDKDGDPNYLNLSYEKELREYLAIAMKLRESIAKLSPDFNIIEIIQDTLLECMKVISISFQKKVNNEDWLKFKGDYIELEKRLREKYLIKV